MLLIVDNIFKCCDILHYIPAKFDFVVVFCFGGGVGGGGVQNLGQPKPRNNNIILKGLVS